MTALAVVVLGGSLFAQSKPARIQLVKTAEFRLSPELDKFPVRDVEWFTKTPSKGAVFVRREGPLRERTLVALDEGFAVKSEVRLDPSWTAQSHTLIACCLSSTQFVVFGNERGVGQKDCEFVIVEIATGKPLLTGTLPGVFVRRAIPLWRKGCILAGSASVGSGPDVKGSYVILRLDMAMKEVWRVNEPDGKHGEPKWTNEGLRLLGTDFVGSLDSGPPATILRFSVDNGARTEIPLTNGEAFSTLVDGRGSLIPVLTRENDQYDINFFDSQGSLVHKRQLSAPLDSRARISPDNVVVDPAGNVWLSEGQSIYQIDVSGDALKRAGPEGDAPFLTRAATANVNRFGQILCLDACTGDLLLFDREGRLLRAEPTSSVDFPTVSESLIHARIEPTGDGDYWIASATGSKMRVRFGPDLIVKQRSDSKYRFFAIEERRSAMCEWAVGQGIAVKFPREPERKLEFDHSLDGVIVDARVLTDGSVAALAYRPNHGVSLFCHLDDPARRVRHDLPGEVGGIFLSSGDRWLIAYGVDGSGFLFDTRTWERWEYELPGDFDTRGVVRCFVDSSQTSGEELVSVNSLTRVVRRFALPKVSSSPESAPAVK